MNSAIMKRTHLEFYIYSKVWQHPFSTYPKSFKNVTFLADDTHTYMCVSDVRNVIFWENLERSIKNKMKELTKCFKGGNK